MGKIAERQEKKREKVLIGLRRGWSISGAARYADISRTQLIKWRDNDPVFAAQMEDANQEGTDGLEDVATSRAKRGKSDMLLMFLLNGARPEKYRRKPEEAPQRNIEIHIKKY